MARQVDICNMALTAIGHKTIQSRSESSAGARKSSVYLQQAIDETLRASPWNCAIRRASLARLTETPSFGFSYAFALPQDPYCLRVLQMTEKSIRYKVEGRKLLTDEAAAKILYIARIVPAEMDPLLVSAVAARLAAELAYPMANSPTLQANMWKLYEQKLLEAVTVDAQEGTPDEIEVDTFINARF